MHMWQVNRVVVLAQGAVPYYDASGSDGTCGPVLQRCFIPVIHTFCIVIGEHCTS